MCERPCWQGSGLGGPASQQACIPGPVLRLSLQTRRRIVPRFCWSRQCEMFCILSARRGFPATSCSPFSHGSLFQPGPIALRHGAIPPRLNPDPFRLHLAAMTPESAVFRVLGTSSESTFPADLTRTLDDAPLLDAYSQAVVSTA